MSSSVKLGRRDGDDPDEKGGSGAVSEFELTLLTGGADGRDLGAVKCIAEVSGSATSLW